MDRPLSAYQGEERFTFICYAHADVASVYPELAWLDGEGVRLWYDEGISPGKNWRESVGISLLRSERVLFYVSPATLKSKHCNREVNLALDEGIEIVPVYLAPVELTADLKIGLSRVQALYHEDSVDYRSRLLGALGQSPEGRDRTASSSDAQASSSTQSTGLLAKLGLALAMIVMIAAGTWFALTQRNFGDNTDDTPVTDVSAEVIDAQPNIAVLPLENLSDDPELQYFSSR